MAYSLNRLVYQYVWRDESLSLSKGLLLTLSDNQAIVLIAVITTLTAFSQTRAWVIARWLMCRYAMPAVQLRDPDAPTRRLSQFGALGYLINPRKQARNQQMYTVPRIFGFVAIANALVFVTLGIVLPWAMAGGIETPLVKSRRTDGCVGVEMREDTAVKTANLADSFFKQCWYNLSDVQGSCDRMEEISSYRLPLYISRDLVCPFPGPVCQNGTRALSLGHRYISPRHVGVNSKSRVRINHELTCAPLKIEHFLLTTNVSETRAILNFGNWTGLFGDPSKMGSYGTVLGSLNGPNHLSLEKSGRMAALEHRPYDLRVFPPEEERNATERIWSIHPYLRRTDATVFVIVLEAGRSYYGEPIDDPLFLAHDLYSPEVPGPYYLPDYEATALGCTERFQLCFEERADMCLPWQAMDIDFWYMVKLYTFFEGNSDKASANDVFPVLSKLIRTISVHHHLIARRGTKALLASMWRRNELVTNIDSKEQWIHELKAWFETALLSARFGFLELVKRTTAPSPDERQMADEYPFFRGVCDRVLFRSGDYTNFYFVWLIFVVSSMMLLSVLSYTETYTAAKYVGNEIVVFAVGLWVLGTKAMVACWQPCSHLSCRHHVGVAASYIHDHISSFRRQITQIFISFSKKVSKVTLSAWSSSIPGFTRQRARPTADNSNVEAGPEFTYHGTRRTRQPRHQTRRPDPVAHSSLDVSMDDLHLEPDNPL